VLVDNALTCFALRFKHPLPVGEDAIVTMAGEGTSERSLITKIFFEPDGGKRHKRPTVNFLHTRSNEQMIAAALRYSLEKTPNRSIFIPKCQMQEQCKNMNRTTHSS